MPNGTLCGQAVVELALADEKGVPVEEAQRHVVEKIGLPVGYLITPERVDAVRRSYKTALC